jgi:hypothetical protein
MSPANAVKNDITKAVNKNTDKHWESSPMRLWMYLRYVLLDHLSIS